MFPAGRGVPIRMLRIVEQLAAGVFGPEEITILAAAFDEAWHRLEKSGARYGSPSARERARQQLGKGIIEAAKLGERDLDKLVEAALLFLAQVNRRDAPPAR